MEFYEVYTDDDLFELVDSNGNLRLPKDYDTISINGRFIKSFNHIKRVFGSVFIRKETLMEDLGDLEWVGGDFAIQYPSILKPRLSSLGKLKEVKGDLSLFEGINDLGEL